MMFSSFKTNCIFSWRYSQAYYNSILINARHTDTYICHIYKCVPIILLRRQTFPVSSEITYPLHIPVHYIINMWSDAGLNKLTKHSICSPHITICITILNSGNKQLCYQLMVNFYAFYLLLKTNNVNNKGRSLRGYSKMHCYYSSNSSACFFGGSGFWFSVGLEVEFSSSHVLDSTLLLSNIVSPWIWLPWRLFMEMIGEGGKQWYWCPWCYAEQG